MAGSHVSIVPFSPYGNFVLLIFRGGPIIGLGQTAWAGFTERLIMTTTTQTTLPSSSLPWDQPPSECSPERKCSHDADMPTTSHAAEIQRSFGGGVGCSVWGTGSTAQRDYQNAIYSVRAGQLIRTKRRLACVAG